MVCPPDFYAGKSLRWIPSCGAVTDFNPGPPQKVRWGITNFHDMHCDYPQRLGQGPEPVYVGDEDFLSSARLARVFAAAISAD